MVDAMRKGADLTVKGTSGRGTQSTDQYSLMGLTQALDKIEQASPQVAPSASSAPRPHGGGFCCGRSQR